MALKEVMRYALELDTSKFSRGLDDASSDAKDSFDSIEAEGDNTANRFDGIGGKMGRGLVAGFAAIGVGAFLVSELEASFDRLDARNILQGKFNLAAEDAGRLGALAGDLYAEGFGESIDELQNIAALASRDLGVTAETELTRVTTAIAGVSKTWEVDFQEVVRATSQLLVNGLAPDAQTALDLIVAGFQNGGDRAGDMLDTIIEYSPNWAAVGQDGEDAFAQIIAAMDGGIYQADKVGDAVKEMRVRIVENTEPVRTALQDIGLDADEIVTAFLEGGPAAATAFDKVIAALVDVQKSGGDTSTAVEIIGTQFEDLGWKALAALSATGDSLGDVTGAAETLSETVAATDWEIIKREAGSYASAIGDGIANEVAPALEGVRTLLDMTSGDFSALDDDAGKAQIAIRDRWVELGMSIEDANAEVGLFVEDAQEHLSRLGDGVDILSTKVEDVGKTSFDRMSTDSTKAMSMVDAAIDDAARRIHRFGVDGVEDMGRVAGAAQDAGGDIDTLKTKIQTMRGEIEREMELDDLLAGFTEIGDKGSEAWNRQLAAVLTYLEGLDDVPDEKITEVRTLIDVGNYHEAARLITALTIDREIRIAFRTPSRYVPPAPSVFGGPGAQYLHDGGTVQGRPGTDVPAILTPGETVLPTHKPGFGQGRGAPSIVLNVTAGMGANGDEIGRDIVDALERHYRNGGRPPRTT